MNKDEIIAELRHNNNLGLKSEVYLTVSDYRELLHSLDIDDYYYEDNDPRPGIYWYILESYVKVNYGYRIDESWISGVNE